MDKITRNNLSYDVLKKLRKAILLGEIRMDEHLAEPMLAERLGTSRGPIRDALQVLIREGFAIRLSNGRVVVKGMDAKDISNIYEVRYLLENYAIEKWMSKPQADGLEAIREYIVRMNRNTVNSQEFSNLDMEFHEQIVRLANNGSLLQSWLGLKEVVHSILEITNQGYPRSELIMETHTKIVEALESRDMDEASSLLRVHLEEGKVVMCEKIEQLKRVHSS